MNIERRFKVRYPLELNVRYQTFGQEEIKAGVGRTVNLSSTGVLVASEDKLTDGMRLRLTIEWPTLLNGTTPLQLVTFGKVVRSEANAFAVALEHYQFRTMKRKPQALTTASLSVAAAASSVMESMEISQRRPTKPPLRGASFEAVPLIAKTPA